MAKHATHISNIWSIAFDKSGNYDNDLQWLKMSHILITFEVFHFDISGNDDND